MKSNKVDIMCPDIAKVKESIAKNNSEIRNLESNMIKPSTVQQELKEVLQTKDEIITILKKNLDNMTLLSACLHKGTNASEQHTDAELPEMVRILYVPYCHAVAIYQNKPFCFLRRSLEVTRAVYESSRAVISANE